MPRRPSRISSRSTARSAESEGLCRASHGEARGGRSASVARDRALARNAPAPLIEPYVKVEQVGDVAGRAQAYAFALNLPELRVSASRPFMGTHEFELAAQPGRGYLFVARDSRLAAASIVGFVLGASEGPKIQPHHGWGCVVYIGVDRERRGELIGARLLEAVTNAMRADGCTHVYAWARAGAPVEFLRAEGFTSGLSVHVWMDRKL